MKNNLRYRTVTLAAVLVTGAVQTVAAEIAMVANNGAASVTVFDMSTDTVIGSVPIGSGNVLDCSIDGPSNLGYVSDFNGHIWAVDTDAGPPALASGTNPIDSSISTEDTTITPDRRFLLSCDGSFSQPVSVIDLATREEVSTFPLTGGCQAVEACADGSVLVIEAFQIRRLTIDGAGTLTDTGETLFPSGGAFNLVCGRNGTTGIAVSETQSITSFTIPGLIPIDTRALSGFFGLAGATNGASDRVYVRTNSTVDAFTFNSATGALGAAPLFTISVGFVGGFFGVEQLALNIAGTKLYVPEFNSITIYSATSGAFVDSITDPSILQPAGICAAQSACGDGVTEGGEACDDGNLIDDDGCDSNCTVTGCGNGVVTSGEQCDDGNSNDSDCCSNSCTSAADGTSCSDSLFCNGTDTCSAGSCAVHAGDPCSGNTECSDVCSEANDSCFVPAGTSCTDDGNECTLDECDGAGTCTHPGTFFTPCDDGTFCNGPDLCFDGSCTFHDGDPCAFNECALGCDEINAVCIPATSGTICFEDGNVCTNDQCNGMGSCVHPPKPGGTTCLNDFNTCTNDVCNAFGSCTHPPVANGTACAGDGNSCTVDQCIAGACSHPAAANGTPCNDSSLCTQTDQCEGGTCMGSDPVVCPGVACHEPETCDPATGACTACPTGYSPGGGGCQKIYAIDESLLQNLEDSCDGTGANRYNGCFNQPIGFFWQDTGDTSVGPVIRVDVQLETGIDCEGETHQVILNTGSIGEYVSEPFACACQPDHAPRVFPDVDTSLYMKGELNAVVIHGGGCDGLSPDANGHYAMVTVTYGEGTSSVEIRSGCRQAMKSTFKYSDKGTDTKDNLRWKWSNGVATTQGEFADPTDSSEYEFCVFGETGGEPDLLFAADLPASNTAWNVVGSKGYKYKDKGGSQEGISGILLKGGVDGKSKIRVSGKGTGLDDPALPLAPGTSGIRVQITNESTGVCWESEFPFGTVKVDDSGINGKVP